MLNKKEQEGFLVDVTTVGLLGIAAPLVFIFMGMNIGMALMTVGLFGFTIMTNFKAAISVLSTVPSTQTGSYSIIVVPLFILMGSFAYRTRLSSGLFDFTKKWLSRVSGNLVYATIVTCAGFDTICSSTPATCATMGAVSLPEMRKNGYDDHLSTGSIAFGGTLGILVPPSTPMILYAVLTTNSANALFSAGTLPGIPQADLGVITVMIWCKVYPDITPLTSRCSWKERLFSIEEILDVVILLGLALGGVFSSWFSVAQTAAIGSFLAMLVVILPGHAFTKNNVPDTIRECTGTFAMIFFIIIGASVFSSLLTVTQLPMTLVATTENMHVFKYIILAFITLMYVFLGMIMDAAAVMMMTVPILFLIIAALGFDLIWFGVHAILVMNFGSISPPIGMCCFMVRGIDRRLSLGTTFEGVLPFIGTLFVAITLLVIFPRIATVIPNLLGLQGENKMKKLGQALNKFANNVAWVNFVDTAFLVLLNVADVVMNKLAEQSMLGAYKVSQPTLACMVFASFACGQVHKTHVHMTLLIEQFPGRSKFIPFFLDNLLSAVLAGIMTYTTFSRANRQLTNGAVSDILHYSVAPFYYIKAVCMVVFMIVLLYDTILSLMAIFRGECTQEISLHW